MFDAVLTVAALIVGGLALWWAMRLEPHWASKDGHRFTARIQPMPTGGQPSGRWREVRAAVTVDRTVITRPRGVAASALRGEWRLVQSTVDAKRGRALYVLTPVGAGSTDRLVMRIPLTSKARPVLDGLAGS